MEEYEYNFKVQSIESFINFCKQNGYKEKTSIESKTAHRPLKRAVCPLPGQPAQGQ